MSEPIEQHIVPACLLKQFSKNKMLITKEIGNLNERLIPLKSNIQSEACFKIMKRDFDENDDFKVYKNNIINPKNKGFCEKHLYSLREDNNGAILPNEIKYFLEKHFGKFETEFGNFIKYWNHNENNIDINYFFNKYKKDVINFVLSNELRGKHFYKNNIIVESKNENLKNYRFFDRFIFSSFLILNSNRIIEKLDPFEKVEAINAILKILDKDIKNDIMKKFFVSNNLDYNGNKNLLIINNTTELKFLLSDVSTSVFYSSNENFKHILELIGEENFEKTPNKITIMTLKPNLLAIVFDTECEKKYIVCNNKSEIKKINALFYYRCNEWIVIYDVSLKRSEIIDENYLKKIKSSNYLSNFSNWYESSYLDESCSNVQYGYYKINREEFNEIEKVLKILLNIEDLISKLGMNECIDIDIEDDLIQNCINSGITVGRSEDKGKILIIKKEQIFNAIMRLNKSQIECLEYMLKFESYISSLCISERAIYFFKR